MTNPPANNSSSRPHWLPLLAAVVLISFFTRLGLWQLDRADEKRDILAAAANAGQVQLSTLSSAPQRYSQLSMEGRYDTRRHLLLDNQILNGRPGVNVLTPFTTSTGHTVLVNRGWLPLGPRRELPEVETPTGPLTLSGRVNLPPRVGRRLGENKPLSTRQWPQLITYLDLPVVAAALDQPLTEWIVQLDADSPGGFAGRDWPVVNFGPERHLSYAWTWFTLAFTVFLVTALLQWRAYRRRNSRS
ncbi:MAG: hypothetical protein Tsb002_21620 [Wenzhouxiangellaceae bacterium]